MNSTGFAETYNVSIIRIANTGFTADTFSLKGFLVFMESQLNRMHAFTLDVIHDNQQYRCALENLVSSGLKSQLKAA